MCNPTVRRDQQNYVSIAQKWKFIILPDRSGEADDFNASILVAQTGGKQDLLKSLDISIYQILTRGNNPPYEVATPYGQI